MRWKFKTKIYPQDNTRRNRKVFLLLPTMDTDNFWRWLEFGVKEYRYNAEVWHYDGYVPGHWRYEKLFPREVEKE